MPPPAHDVEFLLEHAGYVRALARQLVFDEQLAQDVEQQTWLAALEHAPRDPRSPRAWLATLVRNFAFRAWRGQARRERREHAAARRENSVTTPDEILEREGVRRELVEAVLALDEPYRTALILRFFDELDAREIATRLAVPLETVRTRIKRGVELLRVRMRREHGREHGAWALALVRAMRLEPSSYRVVATAAAKTLIQGVLVMSVVQKAVIGAAAVALLAASLALWQTSRSAEPANHAALAAESPTPTLPAKDEHHSEPVAGGERAEVASSTPAQPAPAAKTDDRYGSLLLHVVWGDDKTPAANIGLMLYQSAANDFYQDTLLARTGDDGSVLIDPILAGNASIYFDRGGDAGVDVERGQRAEKTVEIPIGYDIEGFVRDADARAVAGAEIYLYLSFGSNYEGHVVAHSQEDGSYSVRSVGAGGLSFVSARAPGRAPTKQKLVLSVAKAKVKLDLAFEAAGGAVEGRIVGPDGSPCAGAAIVVGDEDDFAYVMLEDGAEGRSAAAQRVFADDSGHFRVAGVADGVHPLQARAKGFAPWKSEVNVVAGRTSSVAITLSDGASLTGVVSDESGAPVARAQVTVAGSAGFRSSFRKTNADGSFAFDHLPLGEFEVAVDADKKGSARTTLFGENGAKLRWDAVLTRGLVLRGHVEAPGRELEKWWINIQAIGSAEPFMQIATTDKAGRFEVVGCPDLPLRLEVHAPNGGNWANAILEDVRASAGEVVIRPDPSLEPSVRIYGRVVDASGKPYGGAQVIPSRAGFNTSPILATDVDTGTFDFGPYPPGDWHVIVKAMGYADLRTERRTVAPGETLNLGDLVLQQGGVVIATIRHDGSTANSKPWLMLLSDRGRNDWLQLDGDSARSVPLEPGHYRLFLSGAGVALAAQDVDVRVGEETRVDVALRRGIEIKVRCVDADDRPIARETNLEISDAHGRLGQSLLGPTSGSTSWSARLVPGSYHVSASDDAGHAGALDIVVNEGAVDDEAERTLQIR